MASGSSTTGNILGAIGAVVGGIYGGPVGAAQGYAIGSSIGNAIDPPKGPTVEGPRLNDLKIQTSTLGQKIPRFYGTIGVSGNIIWLEKNQLKETVRKQKQGGKGGGGGQTVKTYSYSATFALCLGEGQISGIRRIWCSDKLIYNAGSDDLETIIANNKNVSKMRFYYGTETQLPDPRIEADMGVGNAPAFRGRTYIVFDDFKLADYGNTLQGAQFKVEVVTIQTDNGLRARSSVNQSHIYLNDTSTLVDFSGGVLSFSTNPSDTRPQAGPVDNYFTYSISPTDGRLLSFSQYADRITCPALTTFNYPLGKSGNYFWSFHINGDRTFQKIYGSISDDLPAYEYTRYPGDTAIGFGGYVVDGILYIFRQRADLSCYVETTTGDSILASYEIVNADGSPYTQPIGDISYNSIAAFVPIVESGGACLWLAGVDASTGGKILTFLNDGAGRYVADQQISEIQITNQINGAADGGVLCLLYRDKVKTYIRSANITPDEIGLAEIISSESNLSALIDAGDIDVSAIDESVKGFVVPGGTIRSALEPLQAAYPFDAIASGYKIKYIPRGMASVQTIPMLDLGAAQGGDSTELLSESREMDTQLPAQTVIKYIDSAREYDQSEQQADRINTQAVNKVERQLPIVMTANKAAGVAEVLQNVAWIERNEYSFTLPPSYKSLEPSDVVTIIGDDATYELRLSSVKYQSDGTLQCSARQNRAAIYAPAAEGGEVPGGDGTIPLTGDSFAVLLDIPVVDEISQNSAGFVAAVTGYTAGWPGAMLTRSPDDGQTFADIQAFAGKCTFGTVRNYLAINSATIIDQSSITVDLLTGSIESITRDQMLNGANYAAYGADGRWEIVRFQNAAQNVDGSYSVSGFVRGERGTEWATGSHEAGDWFVLLDDPDNAFIGMSAEAIGIAFQYRAVTAGDSVDDAKGVNFAYKGVNLECLSPVYASGVRDGSGNLSVSFTRRSRLSGTWWTTGTPSPVGESSESYEVDVMNGMAVVRTITTTTPSFTYSAANQVSDFGSIQSSLTFRIYQLSGIVGRGYPLEATI